MRNMSVVICLATAEIAGCTDAENTGNPHPDEGYEAHDSSVPDAAPVVTAVPPISYADGRIDLPCNGWTGLCNLRYDEITYPGTHASAAYLPSVFRYPAQTASLRAQLDASMRALFLEVHEIDGELRLCAEDCALGETPLVPQLSDIRTFLDVNPREVVTLYVDSRAAPAALSDAFTQAGLDVYAHSQLSTDPWPTLEALIESGRRIVVFASFAADNAADAAAIPEWLLPASAFTSSTRSDATAASELDCVPALGSKDAPLMIVNHFLVKAVNVDSGVYLAPDASLVATVNENPFLLERLQGCEVSQARRINIVAVDFYETSDVVLATQVLNGQRP